MWFTVFVRFGVSAWGCAILDNGLGIRAGAGAGAGAGHIPFASSLFTHNISEF